MSYTITNIGTAQAVVRHFESSEQIAAFYGPDALRNAQEFHRIISGPEMPPLAVPPVPVGHPRFRDSPIGMQWNHFNRFSGTREFITISFIKDEGELENCCSVAAMAWHEVGKAAPKLFPDAITGYDNRDAWLAYLKQRRGE